MTKTDKDNEAPRVPIASDCTQVAQTIDPGRSTRSLTFRTSDLSIIRGTPHGQGAAPGRLIPPFDVERVEAIQAAIDAGRFEPHPDAIADKLIENFDELLSCKRRLRRLG